MTPVSRTAPRRIASGMRSPRRLVVIGTGMAGLTVAEEVVRRRSLGEWRVTLIGEERPAPYNRILVSKLLAGTCGPGELELRPATWFSEHAVELLSGRAVTTIDLDRRILADDRGRTHHFDALVLATRVAAADPPIPGADLPTCTPSGRPPDVDDARREAVVAATASPSCSEAACSASRRRPACTRSASRVTVDRARRVSDAAAARSRAPAALLGRRLAALGLDARIARSAVGDRSRARCASTIGSAARRRRWS